MPRFQKILLLAAGLFILLVGYVNCSTSSYNTQQTAPSAPLSNPPVVSKKLSIAGLASAGIFDPSITVDPVTTTLWMSYSSVSTSAMWGPSQNNISVHIRLAFSNDQGESWTDLGPVNSYKDVVLPLMAPNNAGTWMNEVSSLVYEPSAPISSRWKLMYATFLKIDSHPRYEHSWMTYKEASSPAGLMTATPVKLFTYYLYDTNNNSPGSATSPPVTGPAAIQLDTDIHADLNKCLFSEPALMFSGSALYLAIQCEKFGLFSVADRHIYLLKCESPCNPTQSTSWRYLGKLFDQELSEDIEPSFNGGYAAPALIKGTTGHYLIVTPTQNPDAIYRGCSVFKFSDLDSATLVQENGLPKLFLKAGTSEKFNGACSYSFSGSKSGILRSELSELSLTTGEFQIFKDLVTFDF